jgi:hypothetical protein
MHGWGLEQAAGSTSEARSKQNKSEKRCQNMNAKGNIRAQNYKEEGQKGEALPGAWHQTGTKQ